MYVKKNKITETNKVIKGGEGTSKCACEVIPAQR